MTLGDLIIRIGSDPGAFSELRSNLSEGKAALTDFGAAVESLSSSGEAFRTIANDSEQLVNLSEAAAGSGADLQALGADVEEEGALLATLGEQAAEAAPKVSEVGDAAKKTGQDVEDSTGALKDLLEQFKQLGELTIAGIGLEKVVEFSTEATDMLTRAQISMTALTGSASTANVIIGQLEELAATDALAFPQLLAAATRMEALLGPATDIEEAFRHIADGAAVAGTSVDTAAGAFDRLVAIGNASGRTLLPLGISLEALAAAENKVAGTSDQVASSAAAAFKALDQAQRVEVLNTALDRFHGIAAQIADDTFAGRFQRIVNDLERMASTAGGIKDMSTSFLGFVDTLFKWREELLNTRAKQDEAAQSVQSLADKFGWFREGAVIPTAASLLHLGEGATDLIAKHKALADEVDRTKTVYDHLTEALRTDAGLAKEAGVNAGVVAQAHEAWRKAVDALNNSMGAQKDTLAQIVEAQRKANETYSNAIAAGGQLKGTFDTLTATFQGTTAQLNLLARAQGDAEKAWKEANPAVIAQIKSFEELAGITVKAADQVTSIAQAIDLLPRASAPAIQKLDDLNNVLDQVIVIKGHEVTRTLTDISNGTQVVGDGFQDVKVAIGDATVSVQNFTDAANVNIGVSGNLAGVEQAVSDNAQKVADSVANAAKVMEDATTAAMDLAAADQQLMQAADQAADAQGQVGKGAGTGGGRGGGGATWGPTQAAELIAILQDPLLSGFVQGNAQAPDLIASFIASSTPVTSSSGAPKVHLTGSGGGGGSSIPQASNLVTQFNDAAKAVSDAARTVSDLQAALAGITTGDASFALLQKQLADANTTLDKSTSKYNSLLNQLTGFGLSIADLSTSASAGAQAIATSSTSLVSAGVAFQAATAGLPAAALGLTSQVAQLANVAANAVLGVANLRSPAAPLLGSPTIPSTSGGGASLGVAAAPTGYNFPPAQGSPLMVQTTVTGNTIATNQQATDLANQVSDLVMQKVITILRLAGMK